MIKKACLFIICNVMSPSLSYSLWNLSHHYTHTHTYTVKMSMFFPKRPAVYKQAKQINFLKLHFVLDSVGD